MSKILNNPKPKQGPNQESNTQETTLEEGNTQFTGQTATAHATTGDGTKDLKHSEGGGNGTHQGGADNRIHVTQIMK